MTLALTTELEAVNTMLHCIGETPVNSLDSTGVLDVDNAKSVLAEVSRAVQSIGWHFNSETDYPLLRSVDNSISIPQNTLSVDTTQEFSDTDVAQRGLRLYDKGEHTFSFTRNLEVDIVFYLEWEDLPQSARHYITVSAARVYQTRQLGSDTLHKITAEDEYKALAALKHDEGETGDYNMLSGSWSVGSILDR
jgi:hypothetical protein